MQSVNTLLLVAAVLFNTKPSCFIHYRVNYQKNFITWIVTHVGSA